MLISGKVVETEILTDSLPPKLLELRIEWNFFAKNIIFICLANKSLNSHNFDHLLHVSFCERFLICLNNITESNYSLN